jgi:hypothetical protein
MPPGLRDGESGAHPVSAPPKGPAVAAGPCAGPRRGAAPHARCIVRSVRGSCSRPPGSACRQMPCARRAAAHVRRRPSTRRTWRLRSRTNPPCRNSRCRGCRVATAARAPAVRARCRNRALTCGDSGRARERAVPVAGSEHDALQVAPRVVDKTPLVQRRPQHRPAGGSRTRAPACCSTCTAACATARVEVIVEGVGPQQHVARAGTRLLRKILSERALRERPVCAAGARCRSAAWPLAAADVCVNRLTSRAHGQPSAPSVDQPKA